MILLLIFFLGRRSDFKKPLLLDVIHPSNESLLKIWYPIHQCFPSSLIYIDKKSNNNNDSHNSHLEETVKHTNSILNAIWADCFEECSKYIYDIVKSIYDWDEEKIITDNDYNYYFPYWSIDKTNFAIKHARHYLTLLVRVNFSLSLRRVEEHYLSLYNVQNDGSGPFGSGCFYDHNARIAVLNMTGKNAIHQNAGMVGNNHNNNDSKQTLSSSSSVPYNNASTFEEKPDINSITSSSNAPAGTTQAVGTKPPIRRRRHKGSTDRSSSATSQVLSGSNSQVSPTDIFGSIIAECSSSSFNTSNNNMKINKDGTIQDHISTTTVVDEIFIPVSQIDKNSKNSVSINYTNTETLPTFNRKRILERKPIVIDNQVDVDNDEEEEEHCSDNGRILKNDTKIENHNMNDEDEIINQKRNDNMDLIQLGDDDNDDKEGDEDNISAHSGNSLSVDLDGTDTPVEWYSAVIKNLEEKEQLENSKHLRGLNFFTENYRWIFTTLKTPQDGSHRLFKLNVFINKHYNACRSYKLMAMKKSQTKNMYYERCCNVQKVPLRRCAMDKPYITTERKEVSWTKSLKDSLNDLEAIIFKKEIINDEWDTFYRSNILDIYTFIKKGYKENPNDETVIRKKKFISNILSSTNNVELFFQVGLGYGTLQNKDTQDKNEGSDNNGDDDDNNDHARPCIYSLKKPWKEFKLFGTKRSLLITVLYIVAKCEYQSQLIKYLYPMALAHPNKIIDWFGTSTSKLSSFPSFVDVVKKDINENDGADDETNELDGHSIIREFQEGFYSTRDNSRTLQKTIAKVYDEQMPNQQTQAFNRVLEKYLFLLHSFKMSFMRIMLFFKRCRYTDTIHTYNSKEAKSTINNNKPKEKEEEKIDIDDTIPFVVLLPFHDTEKEGEEGLYFNTQYTLPFIDEIIKRVKFWKKSSSQTGDAFSKAFEKCIPYRSQCRSTPKKTKDTCKKDITAFQYFERILFLSLTGGYCRKYAENFIHVVDPFKEPTRNSDGELEGKEEEKEGRFFNYTIRPSFSSCMIIIDKILQNPYDNVKKTLDFIKFQKNFTEHVWRNVLIHTVHEFPQLRTEHPWLSWPCLENSTDFAINCYCYNIDEILLLNRYQYGGFEFENIPSIKEKEKEKKSNSDDEDKKRHQDEGDQRVKGVLNVKSLYTENVIHKMKRYESFDVLRQVLNYEDVFGKVKKMGRIYAFMKDEFLSKIHSKMTSYQDQLIIYEMELKHDIDDLKKGYDLLVKSNKKKRKMRNATRCDNDNHNQDTPVIKIEGGEDINTVDSIAKKKIVEGTDCFSNAGLYWDVEEGCWCCDEVFHKSTLQNEEDNLQLTLKRVLLDVLDKSKDYRVPECLIDVANAFARRRRERERQYYKNSSIINANKNINNDDDLDNKFNDLMSTIDDATLDAIVEQHADMRDLLRDPMFKLTEKTLNHYLINKELELENYTYETTLEESTKTFIRNFTMIGHMGWDKTYEETRDLLTEHLTPEGLEIYSELRDLYPDKMKPKLIKSILESASLNVLCRLYYMFRMQQFANSISLIPIDKNTMDKIETAMYNKRYGLIRELEVLPDNAYDVYITTCCNRITTEEKPGSYGQRDILFNNSRNMYGCNRKMKKKSISSTYTNYLSAATTNTTNTVNANQHQKRQEYLKNIGIDDLDIGLTSDSNNNDIGVLEFIFEEGTSDRHHHHRPSLDKKSKVNVHNNQKGKKYFDGEGEEEEEEDTDSNEDTDSYDSDEENIDKKGLKTNAAGHHHHGGLADTDIRGRDDKSKYREAKRKKRFEETTQCQKGQALKIHLKGYRIEHCVRRKDVKTYGHCPTCAQFHAIDTRCDYGIGGYACERCRKISPENYIVRQCTHCKCFISDQQYMKTLRIPMIDIYDVNQPIKRLPYCKYHMPRYDWSTNSASEREEYKRSLRMTLQEKINDRSRDENGVVDRKRTKRGPVVYDSALTPTLFFYEHQEKTLKTGPFNSSHSRQKNKMPKITTSMPSSLYSTNSLENKGDTWEDVEKRFISKSLRK